MVEGWRNYVRKVRVICGHILDLPEETAGSQTTIQIAVVGMPGAGKSTLLNAMAGKKVCKTEASHNSCTQAVMACDFNMTRSGRCFSVRALDTPGFPDTDPEQAVARYDEVIQVCKSPLHAVLWVVKYERAIPGTFQLYATLLREFQDLKAPLILVINNFQLACPFDDKEQEQERKGGLFVDMSRFRDQLLETTKLKVLTSFSAMEMKDLADVTDWFLPLLGGAKGSPTLRPFAKIKLYFSESRSQKELQLAGVEVLMRTVHGEKEQVARLDTQLDRLKAYRSNPLHFLLVIPPIVYEIQISYGRAALESSKRLLEKLEDQLRMMRNDTERAEAAFDARLKEFKPLLEALQGHGASEG